MNLKPVLVAVLVLMLAASVTAVVDPNGTHTDGSGDMTITSGGSSASATTGVSENGTEYRATVEQRDSACRSDPVDTAVDSMQSSEQADNGYNVTWTGHIETADPCHTVRHTVEQAGPDRYVVNVTTESSGEPCSQCVGKVSYDASFMARGEHTLEIQHDGETVETVEHGSGSPPPQDDEERGFLAGLLAWVQALF